MQLLSVTMLLFGLISVSILTSSGSTILESGHDDLAGYNNSNNVFQVFRQWMENFHVKYDDLVTMWRKYKVFRQNRQKVLERNKKHKGLATFALTQFADLSSEEFSQFHLSPGLGKIINRTLPFRVYQNYGTVPRDFAKEIDWTSKGVVTSVKHQGHVGTCYIFSTLGMIESRWAMKGNQLVSLSAEQVTDCLAVSNDPYLDNVACGVNGGTTQSVLQYIKKEGRLATEESYPYCVGTGACRPCAPKNYNSFLCQKYPIQNCLEEESCEIQLNKSTFVNGLKVSKWSLVSQDENVIAQVLAKEGPLTCAVDAVDLQFYHSGILVPDRCKPGNLNHASLLVGYGTENGRDYWKVKNSWGSQFGEGGYFRIARGICACGINTYVNTVALE